MKKKKKSTKSVYNNTEIIINFVELENNKYSINLDIDFDINNSKKISSHLNYLYKKCLINAVLGYYKFS